MNAASRVHGTIHGRAFVELMQLREDIDEWSIDMDISHPESDKNFLRPDITGFKADRICVVVEVCLTSAKKDYGSAKAFYEECEIEEYLIVNIQKRAVTRFFLTDGHYSEIKNSMSMELKKKLFDV